MGRSYDSYDSSQRPLEGSSIDCNPYIDQFDDGKVRNSLLAFASQLMKWIVIDAHGAYSQ
jgi:hypothetical protein